MKKIKIPINNDGWKFIIGLSVPGIWFMTFDGIWLFQILGALALAGGMFSIAFFRDPDRQPDGEGVLSPADGTVTEVKSVTQADGEGYGKGKVVRIFLSVFNNHVQKAPLAGKVVGRQYQKGKFLDARDPKAHLLNENNEIHFQTEAGPVMVKQIAGLIARRIVCGVKKDQILARGERLGLIRFGSQVNLYVPPRVEITVKAGDKVYGGKTVLGVVGKERP